MAKKSYLDNPALQFISSAIVNETPPEAPLSPAPETEEIIDEPAAPKAERKAPKRAEQSEPKKKPQPKAEPRPINVIEAEAGKEPTRVPMKLYYVEVRSKRVNVLMQPSLYDKLSEVAKYNGVSVNEVIHRACEDFVQK